MRPAAQPRGVRWLSPHSYLDDLEGPDEHTSQTTNCNKVNPMVTTWPIRLAVALVLLLLSACITTPYRDISVSQLTDTQLVEELTACAAGLGESINRAQYLMATKPDPAYFLSSSTTNYFGTYTANISAYAMPVGYGYQAYGRAYGSYSGTGYTQYYYTDANAFARSMHNLGAAIAQAQAASYRARGLEVFAELQGRIARRSAETQILISEFFRENPGLEPRKKLIGAILPWVVSKGAQLSPREALEEATKIILTLGRGEGMTGNWYGVFSQTSTLDNGQTVSFNQFSRVDLQQKANIVTGKGEIGTGEQLEISGRVENGRFEGIVANITSAINSRLSGIVADEQVVVEFSGAGVGHRVQGDTVLFR
jgi:hypothetical protein